jgi:putative addiction module component (TIGR02574 family)
MSSVNFNELLELPINERLKLVSVLWDSISNDPDSLKLTEMEKKILDERMEAYMKNPTEGKPWSEIKSDLLTR